MISRSTRITACVASILCAPVCAQEVIHPADTMTMDSGIWFGASVRIVDGHILTFRSDSDANSNFAVLHIFDSETLELQDTYQYNGPMNISNVGARSIDLVGDQLLVGVSWSDNETGGNAGDVYLYEMGSESEPASFSPIVGVGESRAAERFGTSVALAGDRVVVSGPGDRDNGAGSGSVYVFNTETQQQLRKIKPADADEGDSFGCAVVVENGVIAIGALGSNSGGVMGSGAVYLYDLYTYEQIRKIVPSNPVYSSYYGSTLAMSGGYLVVGAYAETVPSDGLDHVRYLGAVYVYDVETGEELYKLQPEGEIANRYFGSSVAISGDLLVVGAHGDDGLVGSAYTYRLSTGALVSKLTSENLTEDDQLGLPVDIDGGRVVVSSISSDVTGPNSGIVYVYDLGSCSVADLAEPYFELNFFDVSAFLSAYIAESDEADINGDGMFDFFDVSQFLTAYNGGCP